MEIRTAEVLADWAAFAVEGVQGFALLGTSASRKLGGYMMVQDAIDSLLHLKTQTRMESAEPANN